MAAQCVQLASTARTTLRRSRRRSRRKTTLDPAHRYLALAAEPYLHIFAGMDEGLCVYFEAVGTNIQARYRGGGARGGGAEALSPSQGAGARGAAAGGGDDWYDIRVFDFARDGVFLPWSETVALAKGLGLPLVGFSGPAPLDLPALLRSLAPSAAPRYASAAGHPASEAELEGYVVRVVSGGRTAGGGGRVEEEPIAKIRVEDMERIA